MFAYSSRGLLRPISKKYFGQRDSSMLVVMFQKKKYINTKFQPLTTLAAVCCSIKTSSSASHNSASV